MSKSLKRQREEDIEIKEFSPKNFEATEFKECALPYERAQSDSTELWLFKLPAEVSMAHRLIDYPITTYL